VIRSVDTIPAETAAAQPAEATAASGKSFATVQAAALKKTDATAAAAVKPNLSPLNAPAGETWKPVAGHLDYAEITDGPRKGKFVNLTTNPRRGQVFTIEEKDGKTLHVYEKSDGKKLFINTLPDSKRVDQQKDPTRKPGKGESWEPVKGHSDYADILDGPRNGLFVNLAPGPRLGMAFSIVKRSGKEFHVYGEGKNRVEVLVKPKKPEAAPTTAPTTATTPSTGATGGTGAINGTPTVGTGLGSS
jgi:hypothetical protein